MIESPAPAAAAELTANRGGSRRRWWIAGLVVVALLVPVGLLLPSTPEPVASPTPPASSAAPVRAPLPSPTVGATSVSVPRDLLRLPGRVPSRGTGTFTYAPGRGKVLGAKGQLRRFRVAVEKGSNEDPAAFAAQVEATLGDKRSWIGNGQLRLQRVSGADKANFTVYLATRDTAGRMCRVGGVNIMVLGRPYTSCRATGRVIINLDRWRLSARPYLTAKVPLTVYRQYVMNHETGHELGRHHEGCPKRGGPAPVMMQQTLTVRGCVPYAWPRRNNKRFEGPSL
ncbi:DUF3152 domain-containing protein [Actinoplanes sp. NPDC049599]|uniref:DUF3152 domain-containing protein n=1 Tax=Actinoplanes sp. NPDC049599 TaxID=3363903 RepID=UPI00378DFF90